MKCLLFFTEMRMYVVVLLLQNYSDTKQKETQTPMMIKREDKK